MRNPDQGLLCHVFRHTADLKANLSRTHACCPEVCFTLSLSHTRFQGFRTDGLVRENPDIDLSFTMQKVRGCHATRLNVATANPTGFQRLQTIFTEGYIIAALRVSTMALPGRIERTLAELDEMVRHVEHRDVEAAGAAAAQHIRNARELLFARQPSADAENGA